MSAEKTKWPAAPLVAWIAAVVIVAGAWFAEARMRVAPARAEADAISTQAVVKRSVTSLRAAIGVEKKRVADLEARFAPAAQPDAARDLALEISALAESAGVLVVEASPYAPDPKNPWLDSKASLRSPSRSSPASAHPGPSVLAAYAQGKPYKRPLERLVVEMAFPDLIRFIEAIGALRYRVSIVRLDIQAPTSPSSSDLTATLILAQ